MERARKSAAHAAPCPTSLAQAYRRCLGTRRRKPARCGGGRASSRTRAGADDGRALDLASEAVAEARDGAPASTDGLREVCGTEAPSSSATAPAPLPPLTALRRRLRKCGAKFVASALFPLLPLLPSPPPLLPPPLAPPLSCPSAGFGVTAYRLPLCVRLALTYDAFRASPLAPHGERLSRACEECDKRISSSA